MTQDMRTLGVLGGKAPRRSRLTLGKVQRELGPLETVQDAQRRLDRLMTWAAAGMLPGVVAQACARGVEIWLKAAEFAVTFEEVERLRDDLARALGERDAARAELAEARKTPDFFGRRA